MKTVARVLAVVLALTPLAWAQRAPRIGYVYPAGGQQGTTFEVTIGGQGLTGAAGVHFTGRGVQGTVLGHERPLSGKETEFLRERIRQIEDESRASTGGRSEHAAELSALKEKLACFGNGRPFNVAIAENVRLRVTMAADASLGEQEIRLATPGGLSNPLVFHVGQIAEFSEPAAKGSLKAEIDGPRRQRKREAKDPLKTVALPAVINGQVLAGEVDRFRFTARRGQRVLVAVSARKLIPYLPDAVPGWFQATLSISDPQGRELAYADDFRFHPDPILSYEIARDGEYEIAIRDSIYRGREDFVYRVTIGELPFITSIFPLGGAAGSQCTVLLRGWNLTTEAISLDLKRVKPGVLPLLAVRGQTVSNFVPFTVGTLPEVGERELNNTAASAHPLKLPVVVNGRIDRPGDTDVFRIEGKMRDQIVVSVDARRLNSPLDSVLRIADSTGRQIAFNDDDEDKGDGLTTHHADSRLMVKVPADGAYFIYLVDAQHSGGPEYGYRLRVSAPQPDFDLRVVPSSLSGRAGGRVPVTVFALRKDGYAGEIDVTLKSAPPGFELGGGGIPAGKDQAQLTLTLGEPQEEPVAIEIEGSAAIDDREVARTAVPADDMQQAFAYHHLVPARELRVAVSGHLATGGQVKLAGETPIKIPLGGSALVRFTAPIGDKARDIQIELLDPPAGITVKRTSSSAEGAEVELVSDASKMVAGEKGTVVLQAHATRVGSGGKARRISLGVLPAIPFEVVGR
jgi:hypothetical protein